MRTAMRWVSIDSGGLARREAAPSCGRARKFGFRQSFVAPAQVTRHDVAYSELDHIPARMAWAMDSGGAEILSGEIPSRHAFS